MVTAQVGGSCWEDVHQEREGGHKGSGGCGGYEQLKPSLCMYEMWNKKKNSEVGLFGGNIFIVVLLCFFFLPARLPFLFWLSSCYQFHYIFFVLKYTAKHLLFFLTCNCTASDCLFSLFEKICTGQWLAHSKYPLNIIDCVSFKTMKLGKRKKGSNDLQMFSQLQLMRGSSLYA